MLEFLKNKKNMIIAGAVSLICIVFVILAVRSDYETVPASEAQAEETTTAAPESLAEAAELTATASDYLARKEERIFSKPASSLKELEVDDEEYIPAAYRLNLAYYYPEDADTSDSIHSYAGEIFQTLNTLNADYLANYYDMSDMTPLSFAQRRGQGKDRVTGKYNPNDSRHDPKNPSTWTINSFRNVNVTFYDGDGNHINGYYVVQEIMSMANVYAYYHDMDDAEAMELYCRALFENAMSSRVSMGNVYYDSGCLKRTKQDEAAEAIAMEIEQLTTEHQLSGATARSSGYEALANYLATSEADENNSSSEDESSTGDDSEAEETGNAIGEGYASYGTGLAGSTSSHENRLESIDSNVVVSGAEGSESGSSDAYSGLDLSGYAVVGGSNSTSSTAVYSGGTSVSTGDAASSDTAVVNADGTADTTGDAVISDGASIQDTPVETAGDVGSADSGAAVEDTSSDDGYVVSPASSLFDIRRIFNIIGSRMFRPISMSLFPAVYQLAEEDYVVSPAQGAAAPAETAAPETIQDAPAEPAQEAAPAETAVPVPETAAVASESSAAAASGSSASGSTSGSVGTGGSRQPVTNSQKTEVMSAEDAAIAAQIDELLKQANVLSGSDQYCPGHIDLYISITIKGIDDKNGLFKADKIGNDPANFNDRWQGWTTDKVAEAKALNHQDWFETYGLSISSINLASQLTEEEIQEYLASLPDDVSEERKAVVDFALHSVGKVPYYWGGKPNGPGYESNNFYTLVGADTSGRILRGLDCSGWVNWVYWSATGTSLAGESTGTLIGCGKRITRSALKPGDIIIRTGADSHVVMFLGWVGNGNFIGIHETGGVKNNVVVGEMTASWPYYRSLLD